MPGSLTQKPQGVLRDGWTADVQDYALVCDWAAGGGVLLVGDASSTLSCLDGKSGGLLWKQGDVHGGGLLTLAVHPNGKILASSGQDGEVVFWSVADGDKLRAIKVSKSWVEHLSWSPEGSSLAVACSRTALALDPHGSEKWRSEDHPSTVSAIAWSGEKELATACYGSVNFYEIEKKTASQKLEWQGSLVSMALSPDGEIVACGSQDNSVHFWRRSTSEDAMMSGYSAKPSSLSFDHSGVLLATGGGERVTVWSFDGDGPEGTVPGELELHSESITCLSFAPRGMRLASGSKDGSLAIWSLNSDGHGGATGAVLTFESISALKWRPDGRAIAATSSQGSVTSWRIAR